MGADVQPSDIGALRDRVTKLLRRIKENRKRVSARASEGRFAKGGERRLTVTRRKPFFTLWIWVAVLGAVTLCGIGVVVVWSKLYQDVPPYTQLVEEMESAALGEAPSLHVYGGALKVEAQGDDIVVTAGAQQAFGLLARILVVPGRTVVAVEQLSYPSLREALSAAGAKVVPVPTDAEGLCVERLPAEARVICVTPSHQFPTGVAMSTPRRAALLAFARERQAVVIEDDYDSEFRFAGRPLDALQTLDRADSVCYVGTFSKSLFPALRLGFVVAPPWARAALVRMRELADWHSLVLGQDALADFIAEGHLARHIRRMRKVYGERRRLLLEALVRHGADLFEAIPSQAGLHLSVRLHAPLRADLLARRAAEAGIALAPLSRYALDPHAVDVPEGLAFGYGLIEAARIDDAIRRVAQLARAG